MAIYEQTIKTGYKLRVVLNETVDQSSNTSEIEYEIYFVAATGYHYHYNYGNSLVFRLGTNVLINTANIRSVATDGQALLIASGVWTFNHNSDGTGSFAVYCKYEQTQDTSYSAIITDTFTCTPIGRVTTFTAENGELGEPLNITVNSTAGYTHNIFFKAGSITGTIASGVSSGTLSWTPTVSLAAASPSSDTVLCILTCDTYSGTAKIGSTTANITLAIPPFTVCPTVIDVDCEEVDTNINMYVQGKSAVRVTATISTADDAGATIEGCYINIGSESYPAAITRNGTTWTCVVTSGTLASPGTVYIDVFATDSRGTPALGSTSIEVASYSAPQISTFTVNRCDSSGVSANDGEYVHVVASMAYSSLSGYNTPRMVLSYVKTAGGTATEITYYNTSIDVILPSSGGTLFSASDGFLFTLTAADSFASVSASTNVGTVYVMIDYRNTGRGVAFGRVANLDAFDVDFDAVFRKDVSLIKDDGTEQKLVLTGCGNNAHTVEIYKGASTSSTLIGLRDATSGTSICRYCADGKLYFDVPIVT